MEHFIDLITNRFLWVALSSWLWAQLAKVIIHSIVNKKLDITRMFGDGGMPSGHSATVTSVATLSSTPVSPNDDSVILKEFVGHTPTQVAIGALLGIINACAFALLVK